MPALLAAVAPGAGCVAPATAPPVPPANYSWVQLAGSIPAATSIPGLQVRWACSTVYAPHWNAQQRQMGLNLGCMPLNAAHHLSRSLHLTTSTSTSPTIELLDAALLWAAFPHPLQHAQATVQFLCAILGYVDLALADAVSYFDSMGIADPTMLSQADLLPHVQAMHELKEAGDL